MYIIVAFVAIFIFIILKNKTANRQIDRRNRLLEKQEELIEMLKAKNESDSTKNTEKDNTKDEN